MKHLLKTFLMFSCFLTLQAQAASEISEDLCPDKIEAFENIQIQQMLSQKGVCFLSVHPRDAFDTLIYRDYLITSQGMMMVFNSFAADESPETTGAREFFFFPHEFKGYQYKVDQDSLVVTGYNDLVLRFSLKTSQIESISRAEIQVKPEIIPAHKGGVEIFSFDGIYLDAGFLIGNSPSAKSSRSSVWKNSQKQECKLKNQEIFSYNDGEPSLKSESAIRSTLQRRCPQFTLPNSL